LAHEESSLAEPASSISGVFPPVDGGKLAEVIAYRIERDVVALGWPIGSVIGSESELIERYGVSRAVLRESVRLLEHHTTARMRRGPGGGLIVTEPRPEALTRPMAVYLEYLGVTAEQVFETRKIIELTAAESAAACITEEGITKLRETLRVESEIEQSVLPRVHRDIHIRIAELSGNPVLPLFVTILTDVVDARVEHQHSIVTETAGAVQTAHSAIVDAIVKGDGALARHRMLRHLEAITPWLL
jgi:DNA-binding FadR family transcriptional regulator